MKKKFSWEPFDLSFLKSVAYSERTPKRLRPQVKMEDKMLLLPYMDKICAFPNEHFIRRYRNEIIECFLAGSTHLVTVMRGLEKIHYRGVKVGSMDAMLEQLRRLNMTNSVMQLILLELFRVGSRRLDEDLTVSMFSSPKTLDITNCVPGEIPLRPYQEDAYAALVQHFVADDRAGGILVMPTGSGKTRVAVRFLIEAMVAKGWQVLWLTHRAMLIDQAASSVYNHAGAVLKSADPERKQFKMICVSGTMHASVKATERDDDVMICSVQSLVRNLPYLAAVLREKVLVVVDEAHHTLAPSYRLIIREVRSLVSNVKLLGLTATPVRMKEADTARLMALFDDRIVFSVGQDELIAQGYLSRPKFTDVSTGVDFTMALTAPERRHIEKWGELSPETLEKLAEIDQRNQLIADVYMQNREQYGKTLIFALNATHCITLCNELQKRGVRCDYIYCAHAGNEAKIEQFRKGELDVLVNIQVLTEGSDIPDIQTVFLTRPTQSDVLLMQMIGRGMRGKGAEGAEASGTETVNIVYFQDIWDRYLQWLHPHFLFESASPEELPDAQTETAPQMSAQTIPVSTILAYMDAIRTEYAGAGEIPIRAVLPVGWYDVFDEDGAECKVLVFSSQTSGFNAMFRHRAQTLDNKAYTGEDAVRDWFTSFGAMPLAEDLQMLLDTYRITGNYPKLHMFRDRDHVDAAQLAETLKKENVGVADIDERIRAAYAQDETLIDSLYGNLDAYAEAVRTFLYYPNGVKPFGAKIEELPEESLPFDCTPTHDLQALTQQVIGEMFGGAYGTLPPISWTNRPMKSYFGEYQYVGDGRILINSVLNAASVPEEVVKYVLYHELLHRDFRYHSKAFRIEERKYPNWTEHERFLDDTFPKFDRNYRM